MALELIPGGYRPGYSAQNEANHAAAWTRRSTVRLLTLVFRRSLRSEILLSLVSTHKGCPTMIRLGSSTLKIASGTKLARNGMTAMSPSRFAVQAIDGAGGTLGSSRRSCAPRRLGQTAKLTQLHSPPNVVSGADSIRRGGVEVPGCQRQYLQIGSHRDVVRVFIPCVYFESTENEHSTEHLRRDGLTPSRLGGERANGWYFVQRSNEAAQSTDEVRADSISSRRFSSIKGHPFSPKLLRRPEHIRHICSRRRISLRRAPTAPPR